MNENELIYYMCLAVFVATVLLQMTACTPLY